MDSLQIAKDVFTALMFFIAAVFTVLHGKVRICLLQDSRVLSTEACICSEWFARPFCLNMPLGSNIERNVGSQKLSMCHVRIFHTDYNATLLAGRVLHCALDLVDRWLPAAWWCIMYSAIYIYNYDQLCSGYYIDGTHFALIGTRTQTIQILHTDTTSHVTFHNIQQLIH